jgi:DNA-binding transcriptional MerR regulator
MADLLGNRSDDPTRPKGKSAAAFRTISEVATALEMPQHVLRFWETRFPQIKPLKRGGGRRYYRPEDIALLQDIRRLLYSEGYTIKGVQRLLRDGALKAGRAVQEPSSPRRQETAPRPTAPPPEKSASELPASARSAIRSAMAELEAVRRALLEGVDEHR